MVIAILLFIVAAAFMFGKGQTIKPSYPINAERFNQYGGFIGGLLGAVALIVVTITYFESLNKSFDDAFFNLLKVHDSIINDFTINLRVIDALNNESRELMVYLVDKIKNDEFLSEYKHYGRHIVHSFFEGLYRILNIQHKYQDQLKTFFKNQDWRIAHYIRSINSILDFVASKRSSSPEKWLFYINLLHSRLTNDEIRILFYYFIVEGESYTTDQKPLLKNLLIRFSTGKFDFFIVIKDQLILQNDNTDWNRYESLKKKI